MSWNRKRISVVEIAKLRAGQMPDDDPRIDFLLNACERLLAERKVANATNYSLGCALQQRHAEIKRLQQTKGPAKPAERIDHA